MIRKGLPGGSYKPLSEEDIDRIHRTAMRIIEEVGLEINSEDAFDLFEKAGAETDRTNHRIRLSQDRVMELIDSAPSEILLAGQDEENDIHLGSNRVYA
jgi:trimethylamine--corrinoid protein Co-methyltransferase